MSKEGEVPNTFVDGRNHLFLSFAAVLAKQRGIKDIVTGVCETDFSGYPDCRDILSNPLMLPLNLAMDYDFVIQTPLMWLDKAETWELADQLGAFDYVREKTLTSNNGIIGSGCGDCPACHLRQHGLDVYLSQKGEGLMFCTQRNQTGKLESLLSTIHTEPWYQKSSLSMLPTTSFHYEGKCKSLHGHTYHLQIAVSGF